MKTYLVGGAVRDELLGLPGADRDHVVVGATPEHMEAQGFKPVGKDFPVFLHPVTHEEYALARTERKNGRGYKGFTVHYAPEVTLEEDLLRRDLTINAMARDEQTGELVDPYGGQRDLQARVLRHVSPAFSEDPVRLLRVARFAARFPDFSVAPETLDLMQALVHAGEVEALVAERVWQELSRGLMAVRPSRMLALLHACGALPRLIPGLRMEPQHCEALDKAAADGLALSERFALWMQDAQDRSSALRAVRAPDQCKQSALALDRLLAALRLPFSAVAVLDGLEATDAFRKPERFRALLGAAAYAQIPSEILDRWRAAFERAAAVDAGAVARQAPNPQAIRAAVREARERAVDSGR